MEFSIRFLFLAVVPCYLSTVKSAYGTMIQSGLSLSPASMTGSIWPRPFSHPYETKNISVDTSNFTIEVMNATTKEKIDCDFLRYATEHYERLIRNLKTANNPVPAPEAEFNFSARRGGEGHLVVYLDECTDEYPPVFDSHYESYTIKINKSTPSAPRGLRMFATSSQGVLRGLESFYQMLWKAPSDSDGQNLKYYLNETIVTDHPRFARRGLMLNTSRHYLPERVIVKILTGMMYNKLNVFHWHISKIQSLPFQSTQFPETDLSEKGSYYINAGYSREMVQRIIEAARYRGIRTRLELNTPDHADSIEKYHPSAVWVDFNVNSKNILPRRFPFVWTISSALWDSKIDTVEGRERTEEAIARLDVFRSSLVRRGIAAQPTYPNCRYVMCLRPMYI